jgi:hypothetical protein
MNTPANTAGVDEQNFRAVMQAIVESPDGWQKNASEDAGSLIRLKLRETGFQRGHILPFAPLKASELTKSLTSELPWKIEEMEAKQPNAVTLNYNDTSDYSNYKLDKFPMYFHTLSTPTFVKHVLELINYTNDPREIVTNNMLLDLQTQEDSNWIRLTDRVVGSPTGVGFTGQQQNFNIYGRIERAAYTQNLKHLLNAELTNGLFLINRTSAVDFLAWGREMVGGDLSEEMLRKGLQAMDTTAFSFFNVPHVATIKRNLVPDNVVYKYAPRNFLGKAYELQPATVYMKKENKVITMYADELLSTAVANAAGVSKSTHIP